VEQNAVVMTGVCKAEPDRRLVWGWASVAQRADGSLPYDTQGDVFDSPESVRAFEDAFHKYALRHRDADDMHRDFGVAKLVELVVVTPEKLALMKLAPASPDTPVVGAFVGYYVPPTPEGDRLWDAVKRGDRTQFSIVGRGRRETA